MVFWLGSTHECLGFSNLNHHNRDYLYGMLKNSSVLGYYWLFSKKCTLKDLTSKLTILLALTSAARVSEICLPDTKFLVKDSFRYILNFGKNMKTASNESPGNQLNSIPLEKTNPLCMYVVILTFYISKTKDLRKEEYQVSLDFRQSHRVVSTKTLSCWIQQVLSFAGIDAITFSR